MFILYLLLLVSIVHDGLHVVSWEKPSDAIADSFEPAVIILLDDIDDGSFHKGQLILLILGIVIDGHNWKKQHQGQSTLLRCKIKINAEEQQTEAFPVLC